MHSTRKLSFRQVSFLSSRILIRNEKARSIPTLTQNGGPKGSGGLGSLGPHRDEENENVFRFARAEKGMRTETSKRAAVF
jgi:hypothetical protein